MEELGCSLLETYKTLEVIEYRLPITNGAPFHIVSSISSTTNLYVWTGAMNSILTIQTYNYQLISKLHTYTYIQSYMFVGWRCQSKNQVHWWTFTFPILFVGQSVHPTPSQVLFFGRQVTGCFGSTFLLSTLFCGFKVLPWENFPWKRGGGGVIAPLEIWDFCFTPHGTWNDSLKRRRFRIWKQWCSGKPANKHWRYFNMAQPLRLLRGLELETCSGNEGSGNLNQPLVTLQGTNISPKNGILKMIFLFPRWDMLISRRASVFRGHKLLDEPITRPEAPTVQHSRGVASQDPCANFWAFVDQPFEKGFAKDANCNLNHLSYIIFAVVKYRRIILYMFTLNMLYLFYIGVYI